MNQACAGDKCGAEWAGHPAEPLSDTARLALDTILQKPVRGIPAWLINPMEHGVIDQLAGEPLVIIAGVSVTRTLPYGSPDDVRREMKWLVEKGPRAGLFLGASSSIAPGVPWANVQALVEGFHHYRINGRQ